jgi:hypothetical protein
VKPTTPRAYADMTASSIPEWLLRRWDEDEPARHGCDPDRPERKTAISSA